MDINDTIGTPDEPKIKVDLDPNGVVQFTVPEGIMNRNVPEIDYTVFRDVDTGAYIYQLHFRLEEKSDN